MKLDSIAIISAFLKVIFFLFQNSCIAVVIKLNTAYTTPAQKKSSNLKSNHAFKIAHNNLKKIKNSQMHAHKHTYINISFTFTTVPLNVQ